MRKTKVIEAICWICNKRFTVNVRIKDNHIVNRCFHSYINKRIFLGWTYTIGDNMQITKVNFKNNWYKVIGFTKWQREVVFWIWNKLFSWQKEEYWECKKCCNEKIKRRKNKNGRK